MKTPTKNYLTDLVAFICFVLLVSTGIILYYNLPKGSGHGNTIWSLDRHEWGTIHFWIAVLFLLVLAFHLILHWRWIVSLTKGKKSQDTGKRVALGWVGLLALLALAIAPIISPVESSAANGSNKFEKVSPTMDSSAIRGSMTFNDIGNELNVPLSYLIQRLHLPQDVPKDIPLKNLKTEYNFSMEDVRSVLDDYKP